MSDSNVIYGLWKHYNENKGINGYGFDGWYQMSDKEFLAAYDKYGEQALTYNDQTTTLYYSKGKVENGEVVIYGKHIHLNKVYRSLYQLDKITLDRILIAGEPPLPGLSVIFKWEALWNGAKKLWSATNSLSGVRNAYKHWMKHSKDFPQFKNAKQYVEGAKDFLHNPPKGNLLK